MNYYNHVDFSHWIQTPTGFFYNNFPLEPFVWYFTVALVFENISPKYVGHAFIISDPCVIQCIKKRLPLALCHSIPEKDIANLITAALLECK